MVFGDTGGRVGVMGEYCPHRGASLVLGRNEDCGLRCLYHGWKMDVQGNVIEMQSARGLMDDDFWSYGVVPNKVTLEAFLRHYHSQGLSPRRMPIEELFHPATYESYRL